MKRVLVLSALVVQIWKSFPLLMQSCTRRKKKFQIMSFISTLEGLWPGTMKDSTKAKNGSIMPVKYHF